MASAAQIAAAILLPVAAPLAVAGAMMAWGSGPTLDDIRRDLKSPDAKVRENAADWCIELRSPSMMEALVPLLEDADRGVRRRAAKAIGKTRHTGALPHLEAAYWRDAELRGNYIEALAMIQYPATEEPISRIFEKETEERLKRLAAKKLRQLISTLNYDESFFSISRRISNKMGRIIYSQAALFPALREKAWSHQPDLQQRDDALKAAIARREAIIKQAPADDAAETE